MPRKLFGVLDLDGKTIHVLAFSAKFCKDEFVRPVARHDESFDLLWEEAKAEGYRCIELGIAPKERNKYQIHDEAPDPWELLANYEEEN